MIRMNRANGQENLMCNKTSTPTSLASRSVIYYVGDIRSRVTCFSSWSVRPGRPAAAPSRSCGHGFQTAEATVWKSIRAEQPPSASLGWRRNRCHYFSRAIVLGDRESANVHTRNWKQVFLILQLNTRVVGKWLIKLLYCIGVNKLYDFQVN